MSRFVAALIALAMFSCSSSASDPSSTGSAKIIPPRAVNPSPIQVARAAGEKRKRQVIEDVVEFIMNPQPQLVRFFYVRVVLSHPFGELTRPSPHYLENPPPHYFRQEPDFSLTRELAYQEETVGTVKPQQGKDPK